MADLFFATDLHGSETCWRKFLNAARFYDVDVLVCGGDMTGKAIVPIVERRGSFDVWDGRGDPFVSQGGELVGGWVTHRGHLVTIPGEALPATERSLRHLGYYPLRLSADRVEELAASPRLVKEAFRSQVLETLELWMEVARTRLKGTGVMCIACPGNDDAFEVDDLLALSGVGEVGEGCNLDIGGFELISTGWVNTTPWHTYREESEADLSRRLEYMVGQLRHPSSAIFNFHAPPLRSGLDDAPALDQNLRMQYGGAAIRPVGSKAVRDVIDAVRPLLSLHGHVHEAWGARRLGRTLAINPGSSYDLGSLRGAIVRFDGRRGIKSYQLVTG
jgi:Icc-related predicted phosphoesterase